MANLLKKSFQVAGETAVVSLETIKSGVEVLQDTEVQAEVKNIVRDTFKTAANSAAIAVEISSLVLESLQDKTK
jgi:hypothetical protein